jgi:hypothetical protein
LQPAQDIFELHRVGGCWSRNRASRTMRSSTRPPALGAKLAGGTPLTIPRCELRDERRARRFSSRHACRFCGRAAFRMPFDVCTSSLDAGFAFFSHRSSPGGCRCRHDVLPLAQHPLRHRPPWVQPSLARKVGCEERFVPLQRHSF